MPELKIPGINIDAGLELYGGEADIFMGALESFAVNTPDVIAKLRDITKENLPEYAIAVHGIKSVSGTIAAEDINERAKKLEIMAKAGDLSGVMAENTGFLKDTEILVDEIKKWLKTEKI